ncbi:MAG TPA: hypothetical protein VGN20_18830 [Mucilaginibacter sp.]|jgi:hypothetical protein
MRILIATLLLAQFCSNAFCQNTTGDVANIKAYVCNVDTNKKLNLQGVVENNNYNEHSIHNTIDYWAYDKPYTSRKKVKTVKTDRTISSFYFKDDHLIYLKEIVPAHDNYAKIVEAYYKNDSVILSKTNICEEHILQIECWCSGGELSVPYNLKITKDSITYVEGGNKPQSRNSKTIWNNLKDAINLTAFDNVTSGPLRAYIDGIDIGYTITTDVRTHSFANAHDTALAKLAPFINQIRQQLQSF